MNGLNKNIYVATKLNKANTMLSKIRYYVDMLTQVYTGLLFKNSKMLRFKDKVSLENCILISKSLQ